MRKNISRWLVPFALLSLVAVVLTSTLDAMPRGGGGPRKGTIVGEVVGAQPAGARGARSLAATVGVGLPIESRLRAASVFECKEDV